MPIDDIRDIVARHARLAGDVAALQPESDLYAAGLTSLTTVHVMLALEDHFDVEFPEELLRRQTFESLQAIADAIESLRT
ncbi:MAG: acyl carrier protein [Alphaproteobacteria bacterium]|nr:acyl carrier protein [Alphaproteobacteria bacterium]